MFCVPPSITIAYLVWRLHTFHRLQTCWLSQLTRKPNDVRTEQPFQPAYSPAHHAIILSTLFINALYISIMDLLFVKINLPIQKILPLFTHFRMYQRQWVCIQYVMSKSD